MCYFVSEQKYNTMKTKALLKSLHYVLLQSSQLVLMLKLAPMNYLQVFHLLYSLSVRVM